MTNVQLTIPVSSVSGLGVITQGQVVIDRGVAGLEERVNFTSVSGNNLIVPAGGRGVSGTSAQTHSAGVTVELVIASIYQNGVVTNILTEHNDNGTHKDISWLTLPAQSDGSASIPTVTGGNFTAPAGIDWTVYLQIGDKIRVTQSTVKYFYVTAVTSSTLTVTGGSDYSNIGTVTVFNYSKATNPQGFPQHFNYTLTTTGGWSSTTQSAGRFTIMGRIVHVDLKVSGTSNSTTTTINLPLAISSSAPLTHTLGFVQNNAANCIGIFELNPSITNITVYLITSLTTSTDVWTATGTKSIFGNLTYEI